jgi:hypothetical protein
MFPHAPVRSAALAAALALTTFARAGAQDVIDDPVHLDSLAAAAQQTSNALCWELHRYHRNQPGFAETYRAAKEYYNQAGALREALRAGGMTNAAAAERAVKLNDLFVTVEKGLANWGDGQRPANEPASSPAGTPAGPPRIAVRTPRGGVRVDVPFVGVRVEAPNVSIGEPEAVVAGPTLERRAWHKNARGSRRSLEREFLRARLSLDDLLEDTGVVMAPAGGAAEQPAPQKIAPPPTPGLPN